MFSKPFLLFVLLSLLPTPLMAQRIGTTLSGKVSDMNGFPVTNTSVTLKDTRITTVTNESGEFLLMAPPGCYTLEIIAHGYLTKQIPIIIQANRNMNLPIRLLTEVRQLDPVVVSGVKYKSAAATRTSLELQDIPQAIVVAGQKIIKQQAAIDLTTITRNISGLIFTGNYSGAGSSQFFNARGFDLNDYQNYRWNGVMIWNLGNNYADNIEQVEFVKGPTSILYGDVAPGGVMNFVSKKPLAEFSSKIELKTGSWGLIRPSLDITGPLTRSRSLRFRLNTSFEKSNSFRDKVSSQKIFMAPALAWDISPKISLNIETVFKKSRATDDAGLISPDGTTAGLSTLRPSLYLGEPMRNYLFAEQDYFATLKFALTQRWQVKATGFYGNTVNRPFGVWFDQPDSAGNFKRRTYGLYQKSKTHTVSVDVYGTLFSGPVRHNLLTGFEYQYVNSRYTNAGLLTLADTSNLYHPVYGTIPDTAPAQSPLQPYVSIVTRAGLYGQDQFILFHEKLQVLIGARLGNTRQGNHYYQSQLAGTAYEGYTDHIVSKVIFTPRIGIVFKLREWSSLYASFSKGYEVNSPDLFAKNYLEYATPPATISTQEEAGSKTSFLSGKLGLTVSLFEINKHNPYGYVYLNPSNPNYDEYNVYYKGHHRSRGIELDIDGKVSTAVSLTAGAAYTKTRVMEDPGYPTGNVLPNAPEFAGNCWIDYEPVKTNSGFFVGSGLFYKSSFFSSLANDPHLKIPAGYTIDAAVGFHSRRATVQLNVMNLTNRVSYLNPWQFNLFDVKPLRQFILTLSYKISPKKAAVL